MKRWPVTVALLSFVALIASLWVWYFPWLGALLSLPLLAWLPGMWKGNSKAYVLGGAFALPYICYAMIEILIAGEERPPAAVALLAASVIFMAILLPATRHLRS